ncbi:MAG: 3-phosphoshikimate 1-carboxyvinyltransferase [Bacteroidaceae bacterium]|nr:3-phosphoshikimate 1-carboxyvinyltransferase [Bacteroidaceae bacterium]
MIITAPKHINCSINLPASKSISNRVLVVSALCDEDGAGVIGNLATCDDTKVVNNAFADGLPYEINIGAAGTAMRFMTAFLAQRDGEEHVITGTDRMKHRPIKVLVDALRSIGASIQYVGEEGYPPLKIQGKKLKGGHLDVPGNISSQYISALLMIAPKLREGLKLHLVGDIYSRPYIDLTLSIMQEFGAKAYWHDNDDIIIEPTGYKKRSYIVENDWSAASYWYEMSALLSANNEFMNDDDEVTIEGLLYSSRQGDSSIRYLFNLLGVKSVFKDKENISDVILKTAITRVAKLEYDFVNIPDMAQTVVVTCCALGIPFHFTGLASLKIKETDRIEALKAELRKVGYVVEDRNDSELVWNGETCEPSFAPIDTYEDHRMAMAFAPLAIKFGKIEINNPEVVSKSYPNFWDDLAKAGFALESEAKS